MTRGEDSEVPTPEVFTCYRHGDAQDVAGRISDRLEHDVGRNRVFMDVKSIPLGADFDNEITQALARCKVLVVVIGRRWSRSTHQGRRRLDDPKDRVVVEIRTALKGGIRVFPVLVDGARMPSEGDLPDDIRGLAGRQAIRVDHETFDRDIVPLVDAVRSALGSDRQA